MSFANPGNLLGVKECRLPTLETCCWLGMASDIRLGGCQSITGLHTISVDGYDYESSSSKMSMLGSGSAIPEGWVHLWPNPTRRDVFVRLGGTAADGGTFLLHNMQGQERLIISLGSETPSLVALGAQPAATYFWTFVSRSGTTYRGKLVVLK